MQQCDGLEARAQCNVLRSPLACVLAMRLIGTNHITCSLSQTTMLLAANTVAVRTGSAGAVRTGSAGVCVVPSACTFVLRELLQRTRTKQYEHVHNRQEHAVNASMLIQTRWQIVVSR
eukprot:4715-Heterococcus_DN1.PRE.1